jgi:3-oxoacyl-[acyl-carrier protein] reductase
MPAKQWDAMLNVHVTAPFRLIQAAAPHLRDAAKREIERDGRAHPRCILTVSSVSGTSPAARGPPPAARRPPAKKQ